MVRAPGQELRPRDFSSSFLSCEKDLETILKKLFVQSRPYSDNLKRLLVINNKDCFDLNNQEYQNIIDALSLADLMDEKYVKSTPKLNFGEHESLKSYIIVEFNNFTPCVENPEFRDCIIDINIFCPLDSWELENYQTRPIKIMGYIDGILNKTKLSGIGTLKFESANSIVLSDDFAGFLLRYSATHGSDDKILNEE